MTKINKRYINRKIYLYKIKKIKKDYILRFNNNTKKILKFKNFLYIQKTLDSSYHNIKIQTSSIHNLTKEMSIIHEWYDFNYLIVYY